MASEIIYRASPSLRMGRASVALAVCVAFLAMAVFAMAFSRGGEGPWQTVYESGQLRLLESAPLLVGCLLFAVAALCVLPDERIHD